MSRREPGARDQSGPAGAPLVAGPVRPALARRPTPATEDGRARTRLAAAALLVACASVGWSLDRHAGVRAANRHFAAGEFAEAEAKYNQALVDDPDSALLHFNLGDAAYRLGKYTDAANAFEQVSGSAGGDGDPARRARAAYNLGNAKYRLGADAEASDPEKAIGLYGEALVAYRRAMGADSTDPDPKFNFEFVAKKLKDLEERLKQEQQRQDEQQQEQGEQQADQQEQDQQDQQQEQGGEQQPEQQQPEQQQAEEQQPADEQQQPQEQAGDEQRPEEQAAGGEHAEPEPEEQAAPQEAQDQQAEQPAAAPGEQATGAGQEEAGDELSRREAAALLDSLRDEEVQPDEMVKHLQGGVVAEPARDW